MRKLFLIAIFIFGLYALTTAQNIGIGTITPAARLHVKGNVILDSSRLSFLNTGKSIFIGEKSGESDDLDNHQNVFVGYETGFNNTTGRGNTFLGGSAGRNTTTGNLNTAVGAAALDNNSTGGSNVAVGRSSLSGNTTGNNNVAIGEGALQEKLLGNNNVVLGMQAMNIATDVSQNVAIGTKAGYNNLTGNGNVFIGFSAGENETGSDKLYIGNNGTATPLIYGDFSTKKLMINDSLESKYFKLSTGTTNGYVLQSDASGNATWVSPSVSIVAAGTGLTYSGNTLNSVWTASGNDIYKNNSGNVGIGTITPVETLDVQANEHATISVLSQLYSAYLKTSSSSGNEAVVNFSTYAGGNTLKRWVFGKGDGAETGSNDGANLILNRYDDAGAYLGRVMEMSRKTGEVNINNSLVVDANNTNTGTISSGSLTFGILSGEGIASNRNGGTNFNGLDFYTANNNRMVIANGGNVGIGTVAPSSKLHITGTANDMVRIESSATTGTWLNLGNTSVGGNSFSIISTGSGNSEGAGKLLINTPGTQLVINSNGNLGIGTTAPSAKLHVNGKTRTTNFQMVDGGSNGYLFQSDASGNASWVSASSAINAGTGLSYSGTTLNSVWTTSANNIYTNMGGNTGIGTATPTEKLEVAGKIKATDIQLTTGATNGYVLQTDANGNATWVSPSTSIVAAGTGLTYSGNTLNSAWTASGNNLYKNNTGNIGIGTSTPAAALHVQYGSPNNTVEIPALILDNPDGGTQTSLQFAIGGTERARVRADANGNMFYASSGTGNHYFKGNGDLSDLMMITSTGRVGIGTSTPSSMLHLYNAGGNTAINVQSLSNNAYLNINAGTAGMESSIATFTNSLQRWSFGKSNSSETGSDAGSDFFINRYNDAGSFQSQPMVIRRNTGYVGINQGNPNYQLDVNGNININSGSGYYIGSSKVFSVSGSDNLFAGVSAGTNNTGSSNTFIGKIAGQSNTGGSDNTALGFGSLNAVVTGNYNTGIGSGAGALSTGSGNVLVGYGSGVLAGSNNIMIGFAAGGTEPGNNKLYIDNSGTSSPLIYGDFSKDSMSVNGSLNIEGALGLKVKAAQVAGTNNPNTTGGIWIYSSGSGTIDLTSAAYSDRLFVILNNTGAPRTISSYRDLTNTAQTSIANNTSLWIVYDGTNWRQIK